MASVTPIRQSAERALATLDEALAAPFSTLVRDACIQRFEYTFEICWKLLKRHLAEAEGLCCASPKACFRAAFQTGLLDESDGRLALEMTDDRNRTVHTYHEAIAQAIYERLPSYRDLLRHLVAATRAAA
jgi:nucleotidyltransferase substrate binding protein (TIGR01987 family)